MNGVTVVETDIRKGFPCSRVDLLFFSDVLYYLSKKEIVAVLAAAQKHVVPGGWLLFANEWSPAHRRLTSPDVVLRMIGERAEWRQVSVERGAWLTIGVFERV